MNTRGDLNSIKRLRSEAGYRSIQEREYKRKYEVSKTDEDGRQMITLDEYEATRKQNKLQESGNISVSNTASWLGKKDDKEMLDIMNAYSVQKRK